MQTKLSVYVRLGAMMFLQYAIWGAWTPVMWSYVKGLGFSDYQAGLVFSALWLACILAPFTGGQVADRWMPSQWFLALVHAAGAIILYVMAGAQDFTPFIVLMGVYALLYAPTLAVTNAVAFEHIEDREKEFGVIRVLGTLGWIVAGLMLTGMRSMTLTVEGRGDLLVLSAALSVLMAIVCLTLPHTPPKREADNPFAFVEAFKLLKDPHFLLFIIIAFIVTTELQFYYLPTSEYLEKQILIPQEQVPAVMAIAQACELIGMAILLPILLPRIGIRWALAIGVLAWPLRYVVFAFGTPDIKWAVLASLGLHGIGYTFFFVVSFIYVDKVAPPNIRASAQALVTLATLGVGNFLGTFFTSWVMDYFRGPEGDVAWKWVFVVPCILTVACAIAYLALFRDPRAAPDAKLPESATAG